MINKTALYKNWQLRETPEESRAEVRLYKENGAWEFYLVALNPYDECQCLCLFNNREEGWKCEERPFFLIEATLDLNDDIHIDEEYRPRQVKEIIKASQNRGIK